MAKKSKNILWISAGIVVVAVAVFLWGNSSAKSTLELTEQQEVNTAGMGSDNNDPWADFEKPSEAELKEMLTPLQYRITQEAGTEKPHQNEYFKHHKEGKEGIYVDVVSGEPLFSTKNQYSSGTGWPSFSKPLEPSNISTKVDYKLVYPRTEVLSKHASSHLGHVFKDGPETTEESGGAEPTGLRYCLNSAALKFIPKEQLEEEGYGQYLAHFSDQP